MKKHIFMKSTRIIGMNNLFVSLPHEHHSGGVVIVTELLVLFFLNTLMCYGKHS